MKKRNHALFESRVDLGRVGQCRRRSEADVGQEGSNERGLSSSGARRITWRPVAKAARLAADARGEASHLRSVAHLADLKCILIN